MKFASLKSGGRDGTLIVVSKDLTRALKAGPEIPTLQFALDHWDSVLPKLEKLHQEVQKGQGFPFAVKDCASPLPRAYQWVDGSAYLNHVELVRKARNAEMPPDFYHDPLMYQGCSDSFLAPTENIQMASAEWGIDFESEVAVITGDVKMGTSSIEAAKNIRLILLVNDVSLRNLIPAELAKGFGFFQSKPASAFSPVAVTPDELENDWREGKVHLPLCTYLNDKLFGEPNAGEDMNFNFPQLIAHAAKTRHLAAGTIVGSGTVSNRDRSRGSSCLAEKRMLEIIDTGKPLTPFMQFGDRVKIEMRNKRGESIFGAIDQRVEQYSSQN